MTRFRPHWLLPLLLAPLLVACSLGSGGNEAPPRADTPADIPAFDSRIALPVSIPLADLERLLNDAVPTRLVTIDRDFDVCVKPTRVKIAGARIPVTPPIRCRIVGQIDRGPVRLVPETTGDSIGIRMPVSASVTAKDVGRVLRETATGSAEVRARLTISFNEQWQPIVKIDVDYDWTDKPGIDFLGRRITFAGKADPELARIIATVERDLPAKLKDLGLDKQLAGAWAKGFTSVSVNRENPEVWLRLTPRQLGFGGFRVEGDRLVARLALDAGTETFLGARPPNPTPTPLPPLATLAEGDYGVRFAAPVIADFAELEPVLEAELQKLSGETFAVPVAGEVNVRFGRPTIYTTEGGKLAIGLPMRVKAGRSIFSTRGTVWLTGRPINEVGSRKIRIEELAIAGDADSLSGDLLLAVAGSPRVIASITTALDLDLEGDFQKLITKINTVLQALPIGDFVATATVDGVNNGAVQPIGQGLFLPVEAYGSAALRYDPAKAQQVFEQRAIARAEREAARAEREAQAAPEPPGAQPGAAAIATP